MMPRGRNILVYAFAFFIVVLAAPSLAFAATFADLVNSIVGVVDGGVIPLFYALAFIYFLIGMLKYFFLDHSEESVEKGKQQMLWGIIGFFVIFCVWGIVHLFLSILPGGA